MARGMSPDDLPLAFTPHATSKLVGCAEDLHPDTGLWASGARPWRRSPRSPRSRCQTRQGRCGRRLGTLDRRRPGRGPGPRLRVPDRHRDRGPEPVLQHARPPDLPQVGLDRGQPRHRDVHPARPGPSHGPLHVPVGREGAPRPPGRHRDQGTDRRLLRTGAFRVSPLGRESVRPDAPLGLCRAPVAEPVEHQEPVHVPRRPVRPGSIAGPRPVRGVSGGC